MGQLIGGWTVLAAGVWWLGGVSFFSWQLPLRLLSFPLVWFFLMQIFTLLASAPAALACSLGGMRPIAAARLVEAGIILEFTAVAIWMLRTPGFAAPCVGGFWMLLLGAEILCRFITPPTATR